MKAWRSSKLTRLFWPLAIGWCLTVGLLLVFSWGLPAEAQIAGLGFETRQIDGVVQSSQASKDSTAALQGDVVTLLDAPAEAPAPSEATPSSRGFWPPLDRERPYRSAPIHGLSFPAPAAAGAPAGGSGTRTPTFDPVGDQPSVAAFATGTAGQDGFAVDLAYDAVWGYVSPGDVITVTRGDGAYGAAEANGVGFFWTPIWRPDGEPADVAGGGALEVYVNGVLDATVNPVRITGTIDVLDDRVVGTVAGAGAGKAVTVTLGIWAYQPSFIGAPKAATTTDASGTFTATFPANDLGPHHYARLRVAAGAHAVYAYAYPGDAFHVDTYNGVWGYTEPMETVTVTVVRDGVELTPTVATAGVPHGSYWAACDIEPGDMVDVDLGGGTVRSTSAFTLTARMDVETDQVTGSCPPNTTVRVWAWDWRLGTYAETSTTSDPSGHYTATFSQHDLRASDNVYPSFADEEGDEVLLSTTPPHMEVRPAENRVSGFGDRPNVPYTVTLYHAPDTHIVTGTTQLGWNFAGSTDFGVDIAPGDVVTLETPTWTGSMVVPDLDFSFETANDRLVGQADVPGRIVASADQWNGWMYPVHRTASLSTAVASPFTATFPGFDLRGGCYANVYHYDANDFATRVATQVRYFGVNLPWGLWVQPVSPGDVLTATLYESDGTTVKRQTVEDELEPWGGYWLDLHSDIATGDWITVTDGVGWTRGLQVPTLTIMADPDTELAWGQGPESRIFLEHNDGRSWDGHFIPGGDYALDWSVFDRDIRKGDWVAATYQTREGDTVRSEAPWLMLHVNYAHDWVEGNLEAGHTLWLTVTESDGTTVKATAELESKALEQWGGNTGFATWVNDPWVPSQPDIQVGDRVYLSADDGRETSARVGTINGELDMDADTVSGTIHAPWFDETLQGRCDVWEENGPGQGFEVEPDGGSYSCDFGAMGWDLLPGHDVAVRYREPDGDAVYNIFKEPAPDMRVEKWVEGSEGAPGGAVVFAIRYRNEGDAVAQTILLTDTLPADTSYVTDSSGVAPTVAEGRVTWALGPLGPDEEREFQLVLSNTADPGDTLRNQVDVHVRYDENDWNNHAEAEVHVREGQPDLTVWKNAKPDDPAPGETLLYEIGYGNDGPVASGPVVLTETLPAGTTLVSWRSEEGYGLWREVTDGATGLVLSAPTVPGDWHDRILLRLAVDAAVPIGTQLMNSVEIGTADDSDLGNNQEDDEVQVSEPRRDARIDKDLNWGQLAPGGELGYYLGIENDGNMAAEFTVTDTLPAGTSLDEAWLWTGSTDVPFPPDYVGDGVVVWNLGLVEPGQWFDLNLRVDIDADVAPNTVLNNCAEIAMDGDDERPGNNAGCVATMVYAAGQPNLYVTKWVDDYEPGDDTIRYRMDFGNYGDEAVYDVHLTDTLPSDTSLDGYSMDWWGSQYTDTTTADTLEVVFERIEPGWGGSIDLDVRLDDPSAGFRWYTNTVEIETPPDDANPADNAAEAVAFSGGEVDWVDLNVNDTEIWGCAPEGPVKISTAYETRTYGDNCWDDRFDEVFAPGDVVTVAGGAGTHPVVIHIPDPFTAHASSITDTVWGQIDALDHEDVNVDLDDGPEKDVETDGKGTFSATFSDVPRGGRGWANYQTMINYAEVNFHRQFQSPDLLLDVHYGDDWIEGNYEAGHTLWITVTESDGSTVKATAELQTQEIPWWGGDFGFSTNLDDPWFPSRPNIQPGDWVYGALDNGYTSTVRVGDITGNVDTGTGNGITGTIDASWWLPQTVDVDCRSWGAPAGVSDRSYLNLLPDGSDVYDCSWSQTEWDIRPGEDIGVVYQEPDGDRVMTAFQELVPYMRIQKWADGTPGEGGNLAFRLNYANFGGLAAEDVVITETLQGMSYISDTSGLPHSGSGAPGDPIVWELGMVDPQDSWSEFTVFVDVTENAGNRINNIAQIATSNPFDEGQPWEKEASWSTDVQSNGTQLWVSKDAWTHDPLPGSEFVYTVDACNGGEGNTNSGWTTVTDTLPAATTLVNWWADDPGWSAVTEQDHLLVLRRPTIDAHRCSYIYLRVHVSDVVSGGDQLCNEAEIFAENDTGNLDDNEQTWCHNVGQPHTNLKVNTWWGRGQLVPGGRIRFNGDYHNDGNLPVSDVLVTETLPANTSFVEWRQYDRNWNEIGLVSPTFVPPNQYVWDVGYLPNGARGNYEVVLQVDGDAKPSAMLTNTVRISPQPDEDSYEDNSATVVETLYDHGPNLRVRKEGGWDDWGENTRRAQYQLTLENVGDEPVAPVTMTDTYDSRVRLDGGVGINYWRSRWWRNDPANHRFTVTLESLEGGESASINFGTITDTEPLPFGLVFTNTAEITLDPDDTHAADNLDEVILTTGPDLFVEKELVAGKLEPGELITFSLRYGNDLPGWQSWWDTQGDVKIEDTLADELTFVSANPSPTFQAGQSAFWSLGTLNAGHSAEIEVVTRIADTVTGLDTFINTVEIASDRPTIDKEPYYDNNRDTYAVSLSQFRVYLPIALRGHGGQPAGTTAAEPDVDPLAKRLRPLLADGERVGR